MPIRVVIATDSPTIREMLRMHLECLGCIVVAEAVDAAQALNLFLAAKPELVMIDPGLPATNGVDAQQLLRGVRDESPSTTVAIVTSDPSAPIAMQLVSQGKHSLILDPGDRGCFQRMWRELAAIYPELERPGPRVA